MRPNYWKIFSLGPMATVIHHAFIGFDAANVDSVVASWRRAADLACSVPGSRIAVYEPVDLPGPWHRGAGVVGHFSSQIEVLS